ncbi:MAG: DUF6242 domain-containing protein [Paludibacter sp.]
MQFNFFRLFSVFSVLLILSSCLDTTTTTTPAGSNDASFVSMTLAGNDSAKTAVFALDASGTTIENIDSLPFRTRIDSLYPTFAFKSTAKAVLHFPKNRTIYKYKFSKGSDSIYITGKDTVDFRQALWTNKDSALWVNNYASDGIHNHPYKIKINVHKVHPELYVWANLTDKVNSVNAKYQKAIFLNNKIYYYMNDGLAAYLFTSSDGKTWIQENSLNGLPVNTPLNDMVQFNGKLFVSHDGFNVFSSSNGLNDWTKSTFTDFSFNSLLCVWNNKLWAVVQSVADATYHFATTSNGVVWTMIGKIPDNFPVTDFSAITISTVTGKSKVLVLGGYSPTNTNTPLKNCWSSEDGVYWVDFSTENHSLDSLAEGSSVISYDNKLLLFGSVKKGSQLVRGYYRESKDEGLSWQIPDTVYNQIAKGNEFKSQKTYKDTVSYSNYYQPHIYQSVIVDDINKRIFLIGGMVNNNPENARRYNSGRRNSNSNSTLIPTTDLWTGKLNRKSFIRQ